MRFVPHQYSLCGQQPPHLLDHVRHEMVTAGALVVEAAAAGARTARAASALGLVRLAARGSRASGHFGDVSLRAHGKHTYTHTRM